MKQRIAYFLISCFLMLSTLTQAQVFSNATIDACNTWNTSNNWATSLKRTLTVAGLPATGLSETGTVLREVRVRLGNSNCRGNLSSYQLRLTNPQGVQIMLAKGLTSTSSSVWVDIKLRDDSASLEMLNEYPVTVQQNYYPYSIGYYNIDTLETFKKFNTNANPNGDWLFELIENTSSEVSLEKVELVFGSNFNIRDVTSCTNNNDCSGASCIFNGVFRGNNNGYSQVDPIFPGTTVDGCSWNGANNNSAWFSFVPTSTTARITISGLLNKTIPTSADIQPIVVKANGNCGIPNIVPTGGCPKDQTRNNRAYSEDPAINPAPNTGGSPTSSIYTNGISANCEFNLSGLVVGDTYFLYVDGNGGASSFFYIEIENGASTPCNFCCTPITVNGPTDVCSQATYTFTGGPGSGLEQWSVTPASAGTITPAGVFTPNPALNSEVNAVISFKKADCEGTLNVKVNKCFGILASAPFLKTCNSLGGEFFNTTGDATYRINPTNKTFTDTFLGNYVQNSGLLKLRGAEIKTFKNTALGGDVCGGVMFYRFFQTGSGAGNTSFNKLNLTFFSNCAGTGVFENGGGTCQPGDQKWQANLQENLPVNQQIDLTKLSPGTYTLQVFYKIGGGVTPNPNCVDTVVLDNSGNYYNATFTIQGTGNPSLSGNNPTTCNGTDGSITISGLSPNGTYAVSYKDDGVDVGPLNLTANASGVISIGNLNAGAYTDFVLQASGGCLSGITLAATSTTLVNPKTTPSFGVIGPFCKDATAPSLPTTSTNSINGSWSPATINTSAAGTTSYTFTPDDLTCSNTTSVNIVINDLPATPAIASTAATCNAAGSSTISNYDVNLTYSFNPAGPSVGAGGVISGMTIGTDYTVTATNASTCSATSANFRNNAQLNAPDVPTINSTAPTCSAPGSSAIDNYDATLNYTFNPAGPVVGAGGVITGMTTGINYTVTATNSNNCSANSASFSNGAQLLPPAVPTINSTSATCTSAGTSTISNYDVNLTYTFNPAGPSVGAGGVISGMTIGTDYTVTATNASTCSATSANFRNSAQLNAPDVPTINSTAATCSAPGSSAIDNYDATLNYTFNPAGPVVGAGGVITGMTTGINYTVTATNSDNCSATSASFSNGAQLLPPAVPTINSTSATCTSAGTSTISNYDASLTYTFNPTGPSVGAGGAITGMTDGVNYSVTATNSDNCTSTASVNFKNDTQLPSPSAPSVAAPATVCSGSSVVFTISGTVGLTVNYTLNGTAGSTVINPGGTADVSVANATADQTLIITDIADATCPNNITDIETKVAVTNLSGSISAPSTACVGATPVVTFTGSGGTAPYSFEYSIDGGASQTITTTSGNSVTLPVSTSAKGTFKYDLINVSDANCSATVSGSATINIEDLTITTSKTDNKVCNGGGGTPGGCVPKGTGVVINEVMAQPVNAAGCSLNTFGNPNCQSIVEREYIELYNPTCNDIDISCYIIGTASRDDASPSSTTSTDFSIIIPNGTILAAKSHYVIGSTKLLTNPNNIDLKIDLNVSNLCSATGRSLLTNGDGWVALYDPTGAAKDAVYWTVSDNQASKIDNNDDDLNDTPCTPTATGCNTAGIVLQSATQIKTNNPSLINYAGRTNLSGTNPNGKTFSRVPDGGDWQRDIDPSIDGNNCNTTCDTNTPGTPGTCDGTATVTANGSGNYSYEWKDGTGKVVGSAATATGLCAGTYTVIVKDLTSNCEQTATVTINNEQPTLNVTNPAPVCAPATIDLTAAAITAGSTPNLIYSYWADKDTTIKITDPAKIDKSGTYYIKGANAGGCAEVKPVTVTITELNLTATTTKNTICNGGGTTPQPIPLKSAKEIFDNNAAQISYAGGSNVDEFKCGTLSNYIPNGKTFSRIPDGGAWQTDKAGSINDKNDPGACANCPTDIVINEILAQPDLNGCAPLACPYSSCFINEGLLNKEYIELYNPSSNPIDISGYMLATSTVNNSPSYSAGFTVRIPAGTILPPGKFYVIGSSNNANAAKVDLKVDLLTSNNYCFVKQGAIDNPVMQNGDGWLALYDAAGNVKDAMYWSLFLNEANKITTDADNYDDAPCTLQKLNSGTCDGSATVSVNTGSGNYNYEWRDQAGTVVSNAITATGLCKGDYTVKVRDLTSLCEKTLTVTIEDEKPVLVIANPACSPTTVDLTLPAVTAGSTGGLSFTYWTDANATNALADPKKAAAGATYYIKGETSGGCTTDVKAVVAGQAPSFVLPPNVTLNHNDTYTGTNFNPTPAGTTIDWINSNTSIGLGASGTGNIVPFQAINTGNASAVATITITPKNGVCIGADQSFTITVIPTSKDVFVPNVLTPNGDGKNDVLKVYGNYITKLEMRIFNQWGELIKVINNPAMGWDGTHNGKPQPVGVYVFTLRATLADGSEITKKGSITLLR